MTEYDRVLSGLLEDYTFYGSVKIHKFVTEGLITSYPPQLLANALEKEYSEYFLSVDLDEIVDGKPPTYNVIASCFNSAEEFLDRFRARLEHTSHRYGYTIARVWDDIIVFEPKYPTQISLDVIPTDFHIFHVTSTQKAEKIKKYGLLAKDSQTHFHHSRNRIYLIATNDLEEVKELGEKLMASRKNKEERKKGYVVFEVNRNYIDKEYLYVDPMFGEPDDSIGLFTLLPIRKEGLTEVSFK